MARIISGRKSLEVLQCSGVYTPVLLLSRVVIMEFSDFTIIAWNMRGVVGKTSRCHMKSLVSKCKPSMLILMETHVEFSKLMVFWKCLGHDLVGVVEAQGHMGGICVLSFSPSIRYKVVDLHHQAITLEL